MYHSKLANVVGVRLRVVFDIQASAHIRTVVLARDWQGSEQMPRNFFHGVEARKGK